MLNTILLTTSALALQAAEPASLDYTLTIANAGGATTLTLTLEFAGDADGETGIILPDNWGGQDQLWQTIGAISVTAAAGETRLETGEDRARIDVHHAPGAALHLSYTLTPDHTGEPQAEAGDYYRPYVEPGWVHLIGHTVFAYPDSDTEYDVSATINTPEGWAFASDLTQDALDINALLTSITVAGDYRILETDMDGAPARLAIRGNHSFSDDAMMASITDVLAANTAYWGAGSEPFLVTVLPLEAGPGHMSVGGTNLGDAFAFFTTDNADTDILLRILTHEHVHTWIPGRVGGAITGEDEAAGYWFSEGFTDFLTQRAAVRAGLWPAETAIENWNSALMEDFGSPVREAPNDAIRTGFWSDGDLQRLPYHRGMIFAALVDQTIRTQTRGAQDLDDVLADMSANPPETPAPLAFADTVARVTGVDISGLIERHILAGDPVTLPADTFGACGVTGLVAEPVFDYGMVGERNAEGRFVIVSVDPDGPAAPAGFEPGMIVVERLEGSVGDATVDSVLRMETPGGEILDLRYRPTNGEMQETPRITIADGDLASNGCAARLAGLPDAPHN